MNIKTTKHENPAIAILGSARSESNTTRVLSRLVEGVSCEILDLNRQKVAALLPCPAG